MAEPLLLAGVAAFEDVSRSRTRTVLSGVLRDAANATYRGESFANTSIHLPRTAGGQTFLGLRVVRTNSRSVASVRFLAPTPSQRGLSHRDGHEHGRQHVAVLERCAGGLDLGELLKETR